ncbi:MAG TPA: 3-deoxy-manno-octulosonate cytidylyltransferase [Bacteroidia bacterium]|nr:3-deoxy-manno-octulosonate cytidylyltransferase [Bacteroidia bacterium]
MKIIGIIPARFASTRFSGKPLVDIGGKPMIVRVYEQAKKAARLAAVYIATDDERIAEVARKHNCEFVMTSAEHPSGTDRCAEAVRKIEGSWDAVINIQGDEPFIQPEQIDLLASLFTDATVEIGTLVKKLKDPSDLDNPNTMKVVLDNSGNGMYFSRSAIPFVRNFPKAEWTGHHLFFRHIGIYGYRTQVLEKITKLPVGRLEKAESLEQLRWLENGYRIRTALTDMETISIDAPQDIDKLRRAGLI